MSHDRRVGLSGRRQAPVRLAVVGFGRLGSVHASTVARSSHAKLAGICDIDKAARERAAMRHSVPATESLEDLLELAPDGIVIASSSYAHAKQIVRAARAGVPVFVEKPLATKRAETAEVWKAVRSAGIPLQIGFQRRHDGRYQRLQSVISSGQIGDPVLIKSFGRDPAPSRAPSEGSFGNGGLFLNSAIHDYDAIRFLLNREVQSVAATGAAIVHRRVDESSDIDTCATTLVLDDGAIALTGWNRYSPDGFQAGVEVIGTAGRARLPTATRRLSLTRSAKRGTVIEVFGTAYRRSIESFVDAIRLEADPTPSLEDARRAAEIAFAARESFEMNGELVEVVSLVDPDLLDAASSEALNSPS